MDAKEYLKQYNIDRNHDTTDEELEYTLVYAKLISETTFEHHRWYDVTNRVVQINDKFFHYSYYHVTGDNSVSDMELEFDWDTLYEVKPVEEMCIVWKPICEVIK